jgi:hypothetical protein
MGGAVQQVAGVGQAAVLTDRGQQQPSWWRWETRTPARLLKSTLVAAVLAA